MIFGAWEADLSFSPFVTFDIGDGFWEQPMQQGVGLKDLFNFAKVLFGVVLRCASQQCADVGVDEIFLDGFTNGEDVGFEMTSWPKIQLATVGQAKRVDLRTPYTMKPWRHVYEAKDTFAEKVKISLR